MAYSTEPNFKFLIANPCHLLALGLGCGLLPRVPGTFGSLLGFLIYFLLHNQQIWVYIIIVAILFFVGAYCAAVTARNLGQHDHQSIVIDEVVGMTISLFMCPVGWHWLISAFILFRIFDIYKPFPIGLIDCRVSGGIGIMLDDVVAGIFTLVIIQTTIFLI